jgi:SAM-dependent methyltransferase
MNPAAMEPFGNALTAWFAGDSSAMLVIRRDDGDRAQLPAGYFFRDPAQFTPIENAALARCSGSVLDVGAGTGVHTLVLQERGLFVTAIDILPAAVDIMNRRGVKTAYCADVFGFEGGPFNTILLLGHGIGMVETMAGLDRFLSHVRGLVLSDGQLLLDSLDVRVTEVPAHLAYHEKNRKAGRYVGETRLTFGFAGKQGAECGWLHVDSETLARRAEKNGWQTAVIVQSEDGQYLARLTKKGPPA